MRDNTEVEELKCVVAVPGLKENGQFGHTPSFGLPWSRCQRSMI